MRPIPFFIHIEKAAGTTVHDLFVSNSIFHYMTTPAGYSKYEDNHDKFITKLELECILKKLPVVASIGGHNLCGFEAYKPPQECAFVYFTLLRNPIERYMSHYYYQKRVMKIEWSLDDFLSQEYFKNFMCKKLSRSGLSDDAIQNIRSKNIIVGDVDLFDKSIGHLEKALKVVNPKYRLKLNYVVQNKNMEKEKNYLENVTQSQKNIIFKNNAEDIKLYNEFFSNPRPLATNLPNINVFDQQDDNRSNLKSVNWFFWKLFMRFIVRPVERKCRLNL